MTNIVIEVPAATFNMRPYAIARMSNDIFQASEGHAPDSPILNYFLYCVSVELGLKASVLSKDNSPERRTLLKDHVRHDLIKSYEEFKKEFQEDLLSNENIATLSKINPYFKNKGMEYFTLEMILVLMNGLSSFPDLEATREVAKRINEFVRKEEFFIRS